ncbi:unnamed protein product [Brassica rapa]|uniref:Uncharacterized protein n=1 Tax=Brassica campestris TaxID=3711 RepID=A0A3P5YLN0_BRACM|nr:unnamed protein product [Brassica rapa]VDC60898.1 unnamed protein product [Brassica rapa]
MERLLVLVKTWTMVYGQVNHHDKDTFTRLPNQMKLLQSQNNGLRALLEQITLLKGNFGSISFNIEKFTGNSIAIYFAKSVMCDGRFNSYVALGGPSWLHEQIQRETARDDVLILI